VLDDFVEQNDIEALVVEGQFLSRRDVQIGQPFAGLRDLVGIDVHAKNVIAELTEARNVHSHTAANIENALGTQLDILADQSESTVLTSPPDVTGMAKPNRFGCGGSCHVLDVLPRLFSVLVLLLLLLLKTRIAREWTFDGVSSRAA
jgi:hypothetical protein